MVKLFVLLDIITDYISTLFLMRYINIYKNRQKERI